MVKLTRRPNTYKGYRSVVDAHLVPSLGHIKIQKFTIAHLQAFYVEKAQSLKPRTLIVIRSTLSGALDEAVKQGFIGRNVAKLVDLPSVEQYEGQVLTVEQAKKLLAAAQGSRLDALLLVAVTTGMRKGELVALRWNEVDLEKGVPQVRHNLAWVRGMGLVEGEPKSKAGWRKIALASVVIDALREHQVKQLEARTQVGDLWRDRGLVFCSVYGGYFNGDYVWRLFKRLLKAVGLPDVRFHDLRHSAATVLLAAGVPHHYRDGRRLVVAYHCLHVVDELAGRSPLRQPAHLPGRSICRPG